MGEKRILFDNIAFSDSKKWWRVINEYNLKHKVKKSSWQGVEITNEVWYNEDIEIITGTNPLNKKFTGFVSVSGGKKSEVADYMENISSFSIGRRIEDYPP